MQVDKTALRTGFGFPFRCPLDIQLSRGSIHFLSD